jgi:NAD(P)H-dependent FMN reductase
VTTRILALVGSLRAGSYNKQLAETAVKYAPDGVEVDIFDDLADVAFYNEDIDRPGVVAAAEWLRVEVQSADALLLVTPEYNGSIPASLKNAIDWISRPYGAGTISGKPLAVIGVSNGRFGGVWAHDDARKVASIAGATVLDDVTLSVPDGATRFATTHPAHDEKIAQTMPKILAALATAVQNSRTEGQPLTKRRTLSGRDVPPHRGVG